MLRAVLGNNDWGLIRECPLRANFYQCAGEAYEAHLERHRPPPLPVAPLAESEWKVLFFGPSYLRQFYLETLCVHYAAGLISPEEVETFVDGNAFAPVRSIKLKNNATITSVINAAPFQNSTSSLALYGLLHANQFTHALFMDPHSDCFFRREMCIPTGDGTVEDRAPTSAEIAQQCVLKKIFSSFFSPNFDRTWIHVLSWCGLWYVFVYEYS